MTRTLFALALAVLTPLQAGAASLEAAPELTPVAPVFLPVNLQTPNLEVLPTLSMAALPGAVALPEISAAAAISASANSQQAAAVAVSAAASQSATAQKAALTALTQTLRPETASASAAPLETRVEAMYENSISRRDATGDLPVAASETASRPAPLARPTAKAPKLLARLMPRFVARRAPALAAAALLFLTPAAAFAQSAAGPVTITAAHSLSLLAGLHPLVTAGGAIVGALYGMYAARHKDGTEASSGDVLASVLRYGAIGGAGAYALLDLTQLAFIGPSIGLKPLSAAVATAAFGRTAFQGKFAEPATTSADRIVGAFPAVAAALGLSIGINMMAAPVALTLQVATGAMAATGVATAIYTALYKAGRSPAEGPGLMGKGYVLQALMSGLALSLTGWLAVPFALMGAAGFGLVLFALARELKSLVPKSPAAPK